MGAHTSGELTVSNRWVGASLTAGVVALLVQAMVVPFDAAPSFGLLVNHGDLEIYRNAAIQVLHSEPLYSTPVPPGGWFTYPPFAALCFLPLAFVPFTAAKVVWFVVSSVALWATIRRCLRVLGYRGDLRLALVCLGWTLVAVDIEAVRSTLWQGQINLILMALLVWDLTRPSSARMRGWSVGIVTGVKLTAVVFVPYLLVTRQWRAAATAAVTAAATVATAWLVLPGDSHAYWGQAAGDVERIGPVTHPGNQSLNGVLANLSAPTWVWPVFVAVAAAVGYTAAAIAQRKGQGILGLTVVGLLGCAVSPLAWGHHWVWVVPLMVLLLHDTIRSERQRAARVAATAGVFAAVSMWLTGRLYAEIERLGLTGAPSYVPAMNAAVDHMSPWMRIVACGVPPAIYLIVATAILFHRTNRRRTPVGDTEPAPATSHAQCHHSPRS